MVEPWEPSLPGVLQLPSGRRVRGRGLREPMPGGAEPTFAVYLLDERPPPVAWTMRWIEWPDFGLPRNRADAVDALKEAWQRTETDRVEIACGAGRGRTGTALACLAVLDGVPVDQAVRYIREHYHPRASETPWQRRFVRRFASIPAN